MNKKQSILTVAILTCIALLGLVDSASAVPFPPGTLITTTREYFICEQTEDLPIFCTHDFNPSSHQHPYRNADSGQPCAQSCDGVADPVHLHSGEFYLNATDLSIAGRGFPYQFTRTYRSQLEYDGPLGYGWQHNYEQFLSPQQDSHNLMLVDGAGRGDLFTSSDGVTFTSPTGFFSRLVKREDGSFEHILTDGTREQFYAINGAPQQGKLAKISDRAGNEMTFLYDGGFDGSGLLTTVIDTLGRPITYHYDADERLTHIEDFTGRRVTFTIDARGDLVRVARPAIVGTLTGNDLPSGRTWRYTYSHSFGEAALNHNLIAMIAPNESADGSFTPRVVNVYETDPNSYAFDRIISQTWGGTNGSGVPAGGTLTLAYEQINEGANTSDLNQPINRTTVIDRSGNRKQYEHNVNGHRLTLREFSNRNVRAGDPAFWETTSQFDEDGLLLSTTFPEGNRFVYHYDDSTDQAQNGNLLRMTHEGDTTRGGDQSSVQLSRSYEPLYNQLRSYTEARGNDSNYAPPSGGAWSAERYTTRLTFDYEEACDFAALAISLGISAAQIEQRLHAADMCHAPLGDVNGDGRTDQHVGNLIRVQAPTVTLLPDSHHAAIEAGTAQTSRELHVYNDFGQTIRTVDAEGYATEFVYFAERDPDGDGLIDIVGGHSVTGGYLQQVTADVDGAAIITKYAYDALGRIVREVDGQGVATAYQFNSADNIIQITSDADGFAYLERFIFDANGNVVIAQMEDRGNTSDVDGNLANAAHNADPIGGTAFVDTVYAYDLLDNLISETVEVSSVSSATTKTRYDANENAVLVILPAGNAAATVYDERDLPFSETTGATAPPNAALLASTDAADYDVRGGVPATRHYRYDGNENLIESCDAADTDNSAENNCALGGDRTRILYDGLDRQTSVIDSVGNQTVLQYDPAGNVVRHLQFGPVAGKAATSDGAPQQPVSANGVVQANNLVNDTLLAATGHHVDEIGRIYQSDIALFVNDPSVVRTLDLSDGVLTPDDSCAVQGVPAPASGFLGCISTRREFDRLGRLTHLIEDDGGVTVTAYDGVGRITMLTDALGNKIETAYDANGNGIEIRETEAGGDVYLTTSFYDALNRQTRVIDSAGQTIAYRYDSRGNLIATADAEGPLSGNTITRRVFSSESVAINDFGNVKRYHYDGLNRLLREELVLTASGKGDGVRIGADQFGRLTTLPDADSTQGGGDGLITTRYGHDANSLLTTFTDDSGNQTRYTYDNHNRRTLEEQGICVAPALADQCDAPATYSTEYDQDGNVRRTIDANGSITQFTYDAINRSWHESTSRGAGVVGTTATTYQYDGVSRLTYASDNNMPNRDEDASHAFMSYDSLGRVVEERQQMGSGTIQVVSSGWHGEQQRSQLVYPDGRTLTYSYDALDRVVQIAAVAQNQQLRGDCNADQAHNSADLTAVIYEIFNSGTFGPLCDANDDGTVGAPDITCVITIIFEQRNCNGGENSAETIAAYSYIGNRPVRRQHGNGTQATYGYDALRRINDLQHQTEGGTLLVGFGYTHDRMNNPTSQTKWHDRVHDEQYDYDSAYQLTAFANGDTARDWALDGVGNWRQADETTRAFSSRNEQLGPDFAYDNNGNLLTDGDMAYTWDHHNRLRTVSRAGELLATYSYDAVGRRIHDGTTAYLYDGWRMIASQGAETQQMVYGGLYVDELVALDQGGERFYYHLDTQFSVYGLSDANGTLVEGVQYGAYGQPTIFAPGANGTVDFGSDDVLATASVLGNHALFTGRRWDAQTKLYYYRARYMSPDFGRFISRDPLNLSAGDANVYRYVFNRPARFTDPLGLAWYDWKIWDGLDYVDQAAAGMSDTLTLGATTKAREWIYGDIATRNHSGPVFVGGQIAGAGIATGLGYGAAGTAQKASMAMKAAQYYTAASSVGAAGKSAYKLYQNDPCDPFTIWDSADFLPGLGWAGKAQDWTRPLGKQWDLFGRHLRSTGTQYGWSNIVRDNRTFRAVSQQYWKAAGGANGKNLHHWFLRNATDIPDWMPSRLANGLEGFRNSSLNLLELPAGVNKWMGGHNMREFAVRFNIIGLGTGAGMYSGGLTSEALSSGNVLGAPCGCQ